MSKIVVDSCCDMSDDMRSQLGVTPVPLTMRVDGKEFVDDFKLNLPSMMQAIKKSKVKTESAAPSPFDYKKAIEETKSKFVITLSDKLSSSHSNALIASKYIKNETGEDVCVLDSKSASAGETLIALKLHELMESGINHSQIIEKIQEFINGMKTYFVLKNYDNLQKNGRLGKVTGSIIQLLNIKLIMGSDGNGSIMLYDKVRGIAKMKESLLSLIDKSGRKTQGENLVISHCYNKEMANELAAEIKRRFSFKKIYVVATGGLSSLYADDQGVILAF